MLAPEREVPMRRRTIGWAAALAAGCATGVLAGSAATVSRWLHQSHQLLDQGAMVQAATVAERARTELDMLAHGMGGRRTEGTVLASLFGQVGHVYRRSASRAPTASRTAPLQWAARALTSQGLILEELHGRRSREALTSRVELAEVLLDLGMPRRAWGTLGPLFDEEGNPPDSFSLEEFVEAMRVKSRAETASGWQREARRTLDRTKARVQDAAGRDSPLAAQLEAERKELERQERVARREARERERQIRKARRKSQRR